MVARVDVETAVRVESLQVMVNEHGYRRKKGSQPQCQNVSRGKSICVRETWSHIKKNATRMDATTEPKGKAFAKPTAVVVSAWLMVVCWQSSKD